ncbi:Octopamine receptor in mushroom bodies [Carabus blaptoides fortunei]
MPPVGTQGSLTHTASRTTSFVYGSTTGSHQCMEPENCEHEERVVEQRAGDVNMHVLFEQKQNNFNFSNRTPNVVRDIGKIREKQGSWNNQIVSETRALNISHVAENGSTATPTSRSATAKDTMNRFVTERNFELQKTAAMTRQLPTMTMTLMVASTDSEANRLGSLHVTSSRRAAHALCISVYVMGLIGSVESQVSDKRQCCIECMVIVSHIVFYDGNSNGRSTDNNTGHIGTDVWTILLLLISPELCQLHGYPFYLLGHTPQPTESLLLRKGEWLDVPGVNRRLVHCGQVGAKSCTTLAPFGERHKRTDSVDAPTAPRRATQAPGPGLTPQALLSLQFPRTIHATARPIRIFTFVSIERLTLACNVPQHHSHGRQQKRSSLCPG